MAYSIFKPMQSKSWTADNSQYTIPTSNRFDILSNYPESRYNEPEWSPDIDYFPRSLPKTSKLQHRSLYQKKLSQRNTTATNPSRYSLDNHNQQEIVKNED